MKTQRRRFLRLAGGVATLAVAIRIAKAESYPSRPVRIIVATGAGGGTDLVARLVAQWLTGKLGQSFIVEPSRETGPTAVIPIKKAKNE